MVRSHNVGSKARVVLDAVLPAFQALFFGPLYVTSAVPRGFSFFLSVTLLHCAVFVLD